MNRRLKFLLCGALSALLLMGVGCGGEAPVSSTQDDGLAWVVEPTIECDEIRELKGNYQVCILVQDGKLGLIDYEGSIRLEPKYETIYQCFCGENGDNIAVDDFVIDARTYENLGEHPGHGYADSTIVWDREQNMAVDVGEFSSEALVGVGEDVLIPVGEAVVTQDQENGLMNIEYTGKYGYIDGTGQLVIPLLYSEAGNFSENGLARVCKDGKWGYIDRNGNESIACKYDSATDFIDGTAAVCENGKWGYIGTDGETLHAFVFEAALPVSGDKAFVKKDGKWGVLNCLPFLPANAEGTQSAN